jgi:beta-phosphoglucomutase-like phosphatase (HAD superfamily)
VANSGPFKAVIFDLDGVLADSEPTHFTAINNVLGRYGTELTHEQQKAQMGLGFEDSIRMTMAVSGVQISKEQLAAEYDAELIELLGSGSLPLPGAVELVLRLQTAGIPIAVASSSLPGWIDATLAGIGLGSAFGAVISGESVEHPKPAPDFISELPSCSGFHRINASPSKTRSMA